MVTITQDIAGNDALLSATSPERNVADYAQANAQDALAGTVDADTLKRLGANDGLAEGEGDDWIEGCVGNDFIFGSAMGRVDTPASVNFTLPSVPGVALALGFSWVAYRNPGERFVDGVANFRNVQAVGAGLSPVFQNTEDGLYYVEGTGNLIDGGAGDDLKPRGNAQIYEVMQ